MVLVAEDEPSILTMYTSMLDMLGARYETFTRGEMALEAFKRCPTCFDRALIDVVLPDINGIEIAKVINEMRPDAPILFITGLGDRYNTDKLIPYGKWLQKPQFPEHLMEALQELLAA